MEILTKFTPSFRLILFLLALPVFGLAQQFPINNQKIVQGVGTTAQGISSYSSSPPTTNPSASTWRHVTSLHMDTVLQVQYIYKRPRWYPISTVRRATPPPATASSGSTTIDYTESIWQSTADSITYYYEEENACWQPIGTYLSSTTPSDVAATGSTGAICYGYGLWYDPDVDSIYAQQGATWTAIGSGASGAVDSIVVLQDSIIVGYGAGVEVTRDTIGYPPTAIGYSDWTAAADSGTPAVISDGETVTHAGGYGINTAISGNTITSTADTSQLVTPYDISGLPSGTGTNQRIVVWTGTNSQGNSTQLQSAAGVTLDANLAYRITGGTTANRPTGAAGMMYWNTSNTWWDYHNGTAWFNPLRSATATGLGTSTHIGYFDTNGAMAGSSSFTWSESLKQLVVAGGTIPTGGNVVNITGTMPTVLSGSTYGVLLSVNGAGSSNVFSAILRATYNGGYTGAAANSVLSFYNSNAGTGTDTRMNTSDSTPTGNSGFVGFAGGTTSGANYGGFAEALRGNLNIGVYGKANSAKNSATNIGVLGIGRNTGTTPVEIGGFFGLNTSAPTFVSAALVADNGASTSPIFLAKDAGSTVFSIVDGGAVATTSTLQIGTLSGTATQLMGATAGNIATAVTLGAGLSFSSGTLNGAFLPLTLTGTTEVNTAGQTLRIRDAGAYPNFQMTSTYGILESDANTYFLAGSPTTGTARAQASALMVVSAGVGGAVEIEADSVLLDGVYPVGTASDSVLVRDAATDRMKLVAQSDLEGVWLKPELENGNGMIAVAVDEPAFEISDLSEFSILSANDVRLEGGNVIELTTNNLILQGNHPVGSSADSVLVQDATTGRVNVVAQSDIGSGSYLPLSLAATTTVVTNGNQLTFRDSDSNPYLALTSGTVEIGVNASTTFNMTAADIDISAGATGGDIDMYAATGILIESDGGTIIRGTGGDISLIDDASNDINIEAGGGINLIAVGAAIVSADILTINSEVEADYLIALSAAPTLGIANAGTGATVTGYSTENSSVSGRFTFTTGTGAMAGGNVVTVTFASTNFPQTPIVQIGADATKNTAGGLAAAVLIGSGKAVPIATTSDFTLYIDATGLANSTRYDFTYTISSAN